MEQLLSGLRAVAETSRIRILVALSRGEFNVSELTQILGQSQPRVSRHLKLMAEAGLVTRHKEGNWVLFRLREDDTGGALARAIVALLPTDDPELTRDLARLETVRAARAEAAAQYFRVNAGRWESLRSMHVRDDAVEDAMLRLTGTGELRYHIDLGTGTGSVLKTFAAQAIQSVGIDLSREMLSVARVELEKSGVRNAHVRHGDLYALPFSDAIADLVTIHQVLHYLDNPARALAEASRILKPGGRMIVVDFAPHEHEHLRDHHAHRRLGIADGDMSSWLAHAGLTLSRHELLEPPSANPGAGLTVSLWLATRPLPAPPPKVSRQTDLAT